MPTLKILVVILLLLAANILGQNDPKPKLVDEFGVITCEEWLARLDAYYSELANDPNSTGWIVLSGQEDRKPTLLFRQSFIEKYTKFRGFDASRLNFLRARNQGSFKTQLWRVPPGASQPEVTALDMSLTIDTKRKPFMLGAEDKFPDDICPSPNAASVFAQFLKANPNARGNLVVRSRTLVQARRKAFRTLRAFSATFGVPRSRLRAFPARLEKGPDEDEALIEYWYLP